VSSRQTVIVLICLLALARALPVLADDNRTYWQHSGGHFKDLGENKWGEVNADNRRFHFVARNRAPEYIELYDRKRDCTVLLFDDRCMVRFGYGPFERYYDGQWRVKAEKPEVGVEYYLRHKYSNKYLCSGTRNGDAVRLWSPIPTGHENGYKFRLVDARDRDYFYLVHKQSGKYLSSGTADGEIVRLAGDVPSGQEDRYRFKFVASGKRDLYYLVHKYSGKYVCSGTDNGDTIRLWGPIPEGHEDAYRFRLTR
jgi:hypothetical protein